MSPIFSTDSNGTPVRWISKRKLRFDLEHYVHAFVAERNHTAVLRADLKNREATITNLRQQMASDNTAWTHLMGLHAELQEQVDMLGAERNMLREVGEALKAENDRMVHGNAVLVEQRRNDQRVLDESRKIRVGLNDQLEAQGKMLMATRNEMNGAVAKLIDERDQARAALQAERKFSDALNTGVDLLVQEKADAKIQLDEATAALHAANEQIVLMMRAAEVDQQVTDFVDGLVTEHNGRTNALKAACIAADEHRAHEGRRGRVGTAQIGRIFGWEE